MSWMIKCRQATHLVLRGQDTTLPWADRLRLRFHLVICAACPSFERQMALMKSAMGPWRGYRDSDSAAQAPDR
jgi:hypothetical protein